MNWLVVWYVIITVQCASVPEPDPYTGVTNPNMSLVCTFKKERKVMSKWFGTQIEADDFIKAAPAHVKNRMVKLKVEETEESADGYPNIMFTPTSK